MSEVELIADSLSPKSQDFSVYRPILQAKLDALRFDEDGFRWVENHLKLQPNIRETGKQFVRSILKIVADGDPDPYCLTRTYTVIIQEI